MPPLSITAPLAALRHLLGSRRWLSGFAIEGCGWALFVLALALAPLSLVQATAAGGIGILAVLVSRVTHVPLSRREWLGVAIAVAGLGLLGISLAGGHGEGAGAGYLTVGLLDRRVGARCARFRPAPQPTGSARSRVRRGGRPPVRRRRHRDQRRRSRRPTATSPSSRRSIAAYAFGTLVLQAGFQRGSALTTAGIATLLTNALPIVAGMTIFGEPLPARLARRPSGSRPSPAWSSGPSSSANGSTDGVSNRLTRRCPGPCRHRPPTQRDQGTRRLDCGTPKRPRPARLI